MSFADLKKNRSSTISKLADAAKKLGETKSKSDDRFWNPTTDKSGNGYAVLRFLPAPKGEELPWVRFWDHGFKGPTGKWYIENSLSTIGKPDPLAERNSKLWATGLDEDKKLVRDRKRRLHYVSNVLVVSDPANPANDGKVFLWKFGKKIFDKVLDIMQPQFADEQPINPFDFWAGADFKLKIRQVEGYRNYDKSEFSAPKALSTDDAVLEDIYNKLHSLNAFIDPANYKSYAELEKRLADVLGEASSASAAPEAEEETVLSQAAPARRSATATPPPAASAGPKPGDDEDDEDGTEEDTLSYFAKLAKQG